MDDTRTSTSQATDAGVDADPTQGKTEPSADPDDEFFAAVDDDVLRAVVDVFGPLDHNALLLVRESGLRARSRSEDCYWLYVDIPDDAFAVYDGATDEVGMDPDALGAALGTVPRGRRVSLHRKTDGSLQFGADGERHEISGRRPPLDDPVEKAETPLETYDGYERVTFEVDAARLQALVGADAGREYLLLESDLDDGTVAFSFVDEPDEGDRPELEVPPADLASPPEVVDDDAPVAGKKGEAIESEAVRESLGELLGTGRTEQSRLCRESVDPALSPMRGTVTVTHKDMAAFPTTFEYQRADGDVAVVASVTTRL